MNSVAPSDEGCAKHTSPVIFALSPAVLLYARLLQALQPGGRQTIACAPSLPNVCPLVSNGILRGRAEGLKQAHSSYVDNVERERREREQRRQNDERRRREDVRPSF